MRKLMQTCSWAQYAFLRTEFAIFSTARPPSIAFRKRQWVILPLQVADTDTRRALALVLRLQRSILLGPRTPLHGALGGTTKRTKFVEARLSPSLMPPQAQAGRDRECIEKRERRNVRWHVKGRLPPTRWEGKKSREKQSYFCKALHKAEHLARPLTFQNCQAFVTPYV